MTNEFEYLVYLVGCASRGIEAKPPLKIVNWHRIQILAEEQSILPLLGYAVKLSKQTGCPDSVSNNIINLTRIETIRNCIRQEGIQQLLTELEKNNIQCAVIKGDAIARDYMCPECRISIDTDILVSSDDEKFVCDYFKSIGFSVQTRLEKEYHDVCMHPVLGCVEIHARLYSEIVNDIWFKSINEDEYVIEPYMKISTKQGAYYTLGFTDHLIFISLHLIKHFISSGLSIRMIMDLAVYFAKNKDNIDYERYWNIINNLKFDQLINGILNAMICYAGFDESLFPGIKVAQHKNIDRLLDDLEIGGWMGFNDKKNRETGRAYSRKLIIMNESEEAYRNYVKSREAHISLKTMFPTNEIMAKRYPLLLKHSWLLPAVWIYRIIIRGGRHVIKHDIHPYYISSDAHISPAVKERMNLFHDLGIL